MMVVCTRCGSQKHRAYACPFNVSTFSRFSDTSAASCRPSGHVAPHNGVHQNVRAAETAGTAHIKVGFDPMLPNTSLDQFHVRNGGARGR